jgi:hypothetical protein
MKLPLAATTSSSLDLTLLQAFMMASLDMSANTSLMEVMRDCLVL